MEFQQFWQEYGKKVGKLKAKKRYARLSKSQKIKIADHLPKYVESTPDVQYRKNPLTYLNGECWNDEIIVPANSFRKNLNKLYNATTIPSRHDPNIQKSD